MAITPTHASLAAAAAAAGGSTPANSFHSMQQPYRTATSSAAMATADTMSSSSSSAAAAANSSGTTASSSYRNPGGIGSSMSQPIDVPAVSFSTTGMPPAGPALYYSSNLDLLQGRTGALQLPPAAVFRQAAGSYDAAAVPLQRDAAVRPPPSAYSFSYTHAGSQPVPDFGFALQRPGMRHHPHELQVRLHFCVVLVRANA
jgi:hypothetical protein